MIQIKINGEALDVASGFGMAIEDSNPIFNERGSQSLPATVPATRRNIRLLHAPHRMDAGVNPNQPEQAVDVVNGAYIRSGVLNITEASRSKGITLNVGFDNSRAYMAWAGRKLKDLSGLPEYYPNDHGNTAQILDLLDDLYRIYREPDPQRDDFAVFPVAVGKETAKDGDNEQTYWEIFNLVGSHGLDQPGSVKRILDGNVTDVTVPPAYGVTPFLRVWRVLELLFADLGVEMDNNPFKEDEELAMLVVLNNVADSCSRGWISYADLLPDCTVTEFLNALWVRFGLVYNINDTTGRVSLSFIKDIIAQRGAKRLDDLITDYPTITYNQPQYVKLSAQTGLDGAAPACERFEDFAKNVDVSTLRLGAHVSQWTNTGTQEDPKWDGDVQEEDPDDPYEPDYPDPEPPEPDYPDYDYQSVKAAAPKATNSGAYIAREFVTGMWYRLDAANNKVKQASSGFFNWDPQPDGFEALELSSDDEFVPVAHISNVGLGTGWEFNDYCPMYLAGARHCHSYIIGSDDEEQDEDTPLAFLFAYTVNQKTIGRLYGEGESGAPIKLDSGMRPTISLLFQFKDGLFARFWRAYDELLRHGNRTVEVTARMSKLDLCGFDMLTACSLGNIRCLVDMLSYSLPAGRNVPVEMRLRTIQTHGSYDIDAEQNIPDISIAARHLRWTLQAETYGEALDTVALRKFAADTFIERVDYEPHGVPGDWMYVDSNSAVMTGCERTGTIWETDKNLPKPTTEGQTTSHHYTANVHYDIYEIHDFTTGPDEPENWERDTEPMGKVTVAATYTVRLVAVWADDV